ncbi:MAG: hypothetical protein HYY45_14310 [Deltaproteobacteria bacterium]|nr:hypothetical protein [Deltaproteobacteria bacterium]
MVMAERYGVPSTKIIPLVKYLQVPLQQIQPGDKVMVMTDDAMDPLVWQAFMAVINSKGGSPILCMFPKLPYHCADPHPAAIEAAKACNAVAGLTTTCLNSGTPGLRSIRKAGHIPIWLMDENTVEILTEGGGTVSWDDIKEMVELHKRIGAIYDRGKKIHLRSEYGTDYTADISGYPKDYHFNRANKMPFQRDTKTGGIGGGTWPYGEIHVEPLPGTGNGTVVWDTTAHYPSGLWKDPVKVTIKDGRVVDITGGIEAQQLKAYLERYGDKYTYAVGGEMGLGTNKKCPPRAGIMRSDKKRYGSMHFGIGTGPDRYLFSEDPSKTVFSTLRLEGIIARVTVIVDDNIVVCENGEIKV